MRRTWTERCLTAACAVGIFLLCLLNNRQIIGLLMFPDEFGYLGNAAALAGKDWHSVMSTSSWYSYGWSLVLAPLFHFFSSMPALLRCANAINALAVVAVFFMQRHLLMRLFRDERPFLATIASAGACCYVGVLTQAELFWSEAWLLFVYTLVTLLLQRVLERPSGIRLAVFSVALYYLYVCHNRMLAIIVAAVMIVAVLVVRRSIGIRGVLLFAASLAAAHIAFSLLKAHIVSKNWGDSGPVGNTPGRVLTIVAGVRWQAATIKSFLLMIVTYVFSISLASYGLVPFGIFMCAKKTVQMLRKGTKGSDEPLLEMWMALSFMGMLAVATLPRVTPNISGFGYNYTLYVRYFEPVCALLIAYGFRSLAEMASKKWATRYCVAYTCIFAAAAVTTYVVCAHVLDPGRLDNAHVVKPNLSGIAFYLYYLNYWPGAILVAGLCGAIGWNVMRFLFKGTDARKMIAVAGFVAVNLLALRITSGDNRAGHQYYAEQDYPLVGVVQNTDMHGLPIYIVSDGSDIDRFQSWLMDETLLFAKDVPADQIQAERYYLIVSKRDFEALGYDDVNGEILGESQRHLFLYVGGQT